MPAYESYWDTVDKVQSLIVHEMLRKIGFKVFENERGYKVNQVLPGDNEEFEFETQSLSGLVITKERRLYNPVYQGNSLTTNRIAANPEILTGISDDLNEAWKDAFGEVYQMAKQEGHPGHPPITQDALETLIQELHSEFELICADPTLDDLVYAINDKNYLLAARFLGVEEPQHLMTPGGGHELANLFTNGDVHIVYRDRDIAVLKPEYNHEARAEAMSQRRRWQRVQLDGEQPEEAFVVGYDDTPVGLFAHVIDGTRLDVDQDVSREYINNVMGFDWNYRHEIDVLRLDVGERVRLQGDFAVQYHGAVDVDAEKICYLPIDNHFASLKQATLPEGETLEQEPVSVHVPEQTVLNIAHDEHENIIVEVEPGEYEFYLLPRGLQLPENRPDWPEPTEDEIRMNSSNST